MHFWRTLRCSAWLGWQVESNWANPWLFMLYVLVKPLAGSMLLVCMYAAARAANQGAVAPDYLSFLFISSTCFLVIGGVMFGMSNAVITDRDSYGMLKFIRISPVHLRTYLVGRGVSRGGQTLLGALITLAIGLVLFPELREALGGQGIAWSWLAIYLAIGVVMVTALGLILASAVMNMARYGMFLSEGVAGVLYLLTGAVFPIDVLPDWLRPVSWVLPPTYWLEGMRRALLGTTTVGCGLHDWQHAHLVLFLSVTTLMLAVLGHCFFRWSEQRAWRLGRYDETAGN